MYLNLLTWGGFIDTQERDFYIWVYITVTHLLPGRLGGKKGRSDARNKNNDDGGNEVVGIEHEGTDC